MNCSRPDRHQIEELYQQNRFVDAYSASLPAWSVPGAVDRMTVEELILAGRLAGRLGSGKLSRWLFREAHGRDPERPDVRYYARSALRLRTSLLDELRWMEEEPELLNAPPSIQASWTIRHAVLRAHARDFAAAFRLADRALDLSEERAWILANRATICLLADRWEDAGRDALESWELSPGLPAAGSALGAAYSRNGRIREGVDLLWPESRKGQSFELAVSTIQYCGALMERGGDRDRATWSERLEDLVGRLPEMMPLADRHAGMVSEWLHCDLLQLNGDHDGFLTRELTHPSLAFFRTVQANIRSCGPARRRVISAPWLTQKHNTCLPSSIATVLQALGEPADADRLSAELTYGGTPVWLAAEWLTQHGFTVRYGMFSPDTTRALIESGIPFVLLQQEETSAHAVVVIGFDDMSGTVIIQDPSWSRWRHILMDHVTDFEAPVGPKIMVVVPARLRSAVDSLLPAPDHGRVSAWNAYLQARQQQGIGEAARILEQLRQTDPEHPVTRYLHAYHSSGCGSPGEAVTHLTALAGEFPDNILFRRTLLDACNRTGNSALLLSTLKTVVEQSRVPGVESGEQWLYPPAAYVARYADLISLNMEHAETGRRLIEKALVREPECGEAYHVLGDILCRQGRPADSILAYRIAANLVEEDHHYARAVADTLRLCGREKAGLDFLKARAERLSGLSRALSAWSVYIAALDSYGHPERARSQLRKVLRTFDHPDAILSFACRFWAAHGQWQDAEDALNKLSALPDILAYYNAATWFHKERGEWRPALDVCRKWVAEDPENISARQYLLDFIGRKDGRNAALDLARSWLLDLPGHDDLEELVLNQLDNMGRWDEHFDLLKERIRRNPDDAWAWREIAFRSLYRLDTLPVSSPERERWNGELESAAAECVRICPDDSSTKILNARRRENSGDAAGAVAGYQDAVYRDPDNEYAYSRIGDLLPRLTPEQRIHELDRLDAALVRKVGSVHMARALAARIAHYQGLEEALRRIRGWKASRGNEPELIVAHAETLLEFSDTHAHVTEALEIVQAGIRDFPADSNLGVSAARAVTRLLQTDDAIQAWQRVLELRPAFNTARFQLASLRIQLDQPLEAECLLREAVDANPLDIQARILLARHLWTRELPLETIESLQQGTAHIPESPELREILIQRLLDMHRSEAAVEEARTILHIHPGNAYCWYLLGECLLNSARHTDARETESAFRTALDIDAGLFEAAESLAIFLSGQQRLPDARKVVEACIPCLDDPSAAYGRLAWIQRQEGRLTEARNAMIDLVKKAPWYEWGWRILLQWLDEDEAWDLAREILFPWPESMRDAVDVRAIRLEVLARAGCAGEEINHQWDTLLADFPRIESIHLRRFDQLWSLRQYRHAENVLATPEKFHPESPFTLARKVQVLSRKKLAKDAVRTAMKIWLQPGVDDWPVRSSWEQIEERRWHRRAASAMFAAIRDDYVPSALALGLLVNTLSGLTDENERSSPLSRRIRGTVTFAIHRLKYLLKLLDTCSWDAAPHRAKTLTTLSKLGCRRKVIRMWKNHGEWHAQTPVWHSVACVALGLSRSQARTLFRDWETRPGVEMYMICNYTLALRAKPREGASGDDMHSIHRASLTALNRLHPDWTIRYLACVYCEACLRLDRVEEFLAGVDRYRSLIDWAGGDDIYYFRDTYNALPRILLLFERILGEIEPDAQMKKQWSTDMKQIKKTGRIPRWAKRMVRDATR